jgi:hypothetical protein
VDVAKCRVRGREVLATDTDDPRTWCSDVGGKIDRFRECSTTGNGTTRITDTISGSDPGRQGARGASFNSLGELKAHIATFIESYNETARPFEWTASEVHQKRLRPSFALQ